MKNKKLSAATIVLAFLLLGLGVSAVQPETITLGWDYDFTKNQDVTGFDVIRLEPGGGRTVIASIPAPSPLPPPGVVTFTTDVNFTRSGEYTFVVIATTANPSISSVDSNQYTQPVNPDPPLALGAR